jgi:histidyl-tRNA synthetase
MACFSLLHNLRVKGMRAAMDFSDRKINKIMQYANQINAQHVVVIGEEELKAGTVELKNMATGDKRSLPITQMAAILVHEKKNEAFLKSLEELNQPFENQEEAEFFIKNIDSSIADTSKAAENLKNAIQSMQKLLDS